MQINHLQKDYLKTKSSIAIILGTSRADGNTHRLAKAVCERVNGKLFNLEDYEISDFDYQHRNRGDDFLPLMTELVQYEYFIFASPVYWYLPSATIKRFMDRFTDLLIIDKTLGRMLRGKKASIIATGSDEEISEHFKAALIGMFDYLGMFFQKSLYCSCSNDINLTEHFYSIEKFVLDLE
jgi:multimeric flavodoxin WrbA